MTHTHALPQQNLSRASSVQRCKILQFQTQVSVYNLLQFCADKNLDNLKYTTRTCPLAMATKGAGRVIEDHGSLLALFGRFGNRLGDPKFQTPACFTTMIRVYASVEGIDGPSGSDHSFMSPLTPCRGSMCSSLARVCAFWGSAHGELL